MKQLSAFVFLLSAGASVALANPFIGTYLPQSAKENGQSCQSLAGSFGGKTPYRIDEGWIEYLEAGCYLKKPKDIGGGAIRYSANCAVEGSEYTEKLTIAPVDKGILLRGDGWEEYWQACDIQSSETESAKMPFVAIERDGLPKGVEITSRAYLSKHWQFDYNGDGVNEYLIQQVFDAEGGGNVYYFEHYIVEYHDGYFTVSNDLKLNGPIARVLVNGLNVVAEVSVYKDDDARCCPSGVEAISLN